MPARKTTSVNFRNEAESIAHCPLSAAMKVIGGRWKPMLLWYVHHGIDRFSKLQAVMPMASEKMLWQQLRQLEADGLLLRVTSGRTVRYAPTELARSLMPVLASLAQWSHDHALGARLLRRTDERAVAVAASGRRRTA